MSCSGQFDAASEVIQELYKEYMDQSAEKAADKKKAEKGKAGKGEKKAPAKAGNASANAGSAKKTTAKECQICFAKFDDKVGKAIFAYFGMMRAWCLVCRMRCQL